MENKHKKIKNIWNILSESSSVDIDSNNLSIFNIIEEIKVDVQVPMDKMKDPIVLPFKMGIVSLWHKNKGVAGEYAADISIDLINADSKVLQNISYKLVIPADKQRMRSRVNFMGLKIGESGEHFFRITLKDENGKDSILEEIPLLVAVNKTIVVQKV